LAIGSGIEGGFRGHMGVSSNEQLGKILNDDQRLDSHHLLNIRQRQSGLQPASGSRPCCAGSLQFLLKIVGLKIIRISAVPFGTLSSVPLYLTVLTATGLLTIFEPRAW